MCAVVGKVSYGGPWIFETRGAQESGRDQRHHLVNSCDLFNNCDRQRLTLLT
jgi:hypothetical protein